MTEQGYLNMNACARRARAVPSALILPFLKIAFDCLFVYSLSPFPPSLHLFSPEVWLGRLRRFCCRNLLNDLQPRLEMGLTWWVECLHSMQEAVVSSPAPMQGMLVPA